jgi:hypothetical protein
LPVLEVPCEALRPPALVHLLAGFLEAVRKFWGGQSPPEDWAIELCGICQRLFAKPFFKMVEFLRNGSGPGVLEARESVDAAETWFEADERLVEGAVAVEVGFWLANGAWNPLGEFDRIADLLPRLEGLRECARRLITTLKADVFSVAKLDLAMGEWIGLEEGAGFLSWAKKAPTRSLEARGAALRDAAKRCHEGSASCVAQLQALRQQLDGLLVPLREASDARFREYEERLGAYMRDFRPGEVWWMLDGEPLGEGQEIASLMISLTKGVDWLEFTTALGTMAVMHESGGAARPPRVQIFGSTDDGEWTAMCGRLGGPEVALTLEPAPDLVALRARLEAQKTSPLAVGTTDVTNHGGADGGLGQDAEGNNVAFGAAILCELGAAASGGGTRVGLVRAFPCGMGRETIDLTGPGGFLAFAGGRQSTYSTLPVQTGPDAWQSLGHAGALAFSRAVRFNGGAPVRELERLLGTSIFARVTGDDTTLGAPLRSFRVGQIDRGVTTEDLLGCLDELPFGTKVEYGVTRDGHLPRDISSALSDAIAGSPSSGRAPAARPARPARAIFGEAARRLPEVTDDAWSLAVIWSGAIGGHYPGRTVPYARSMGWLKEHGISGRPLSAFGRLADELREKRSLTCQEADEALAAALEGALAGGGI